MIIERDENGYFDKVITVHPIAPISQKVYINSTHTVYEYGWDIFPKGKSFYILKLIYSPLQILRVIVSATRLVRRENIDVIRATDPYFMGFIAWGVSFLSKVPFCISIHSDYDKRYELDGKSGAPTLFGMRKIAKLLERFVFKRADLVMPIRQTLSDYAIRHGANENIIRVIPHGISFSQFTMKSLINIYEKFDISSDVKILGFVGRLSNENYIDDILLMVKELSNIRNDFIVLMIGGGVEEKRIQQIVNLDPALCDFVYVAGFQLRDIALEVRKQSTVNLCLMAGFSLIEACAAGRPVISYDVEWHHELVLDGKTGYLVAEHDIYALVKAVNLLLDDSTKAEKMGREARHRAHVRHEIAETSAIKIKCYKELMGVK